MLAWALDLGGDVVVDDSEILAGEHAAVFVAVNEVLPHREVDVDVLHCPVCRHAYLAVLAATRCGRPVVGEQIRLGGMRREDVLALIVLPLKG